MARIDGKIIFVTTSPRTPAKMIPEIELLNTHFSGQMWNTDSQRAFMELLKEENFFNGEGANDPAFSARDRINRAPKSLGFVVLSPAIRLTPAGSWNFIRKCIETGNLPYRPPVTIISLIKPKKYGKEKRHQRQR